MEIDAAFRITIEYSVSGDKKSVSVSASTFFDYVE